MVSGRRAPARARWAISTPTPRAAELFGQQAKTRRGGTCYSLIFMLQQACEAGGDGPDLTCSHQADHIAGVLVGLAAGPPLSDPIADLVRLCREKRGWASDLHKDRALIIRVEALDQHSIVVHRRKFDAIHFPDRHLVVRRDRDAPPSRTGSVRELTRYQQVNGNVQDLFPYPHAADPRSWLDAMGSAEFKSSSAHGVLKPWIGAEHGPVDADVSVGRVEGYG